MARDKLSKLKHEVKALEVEVNSLHIQKNELGEMLTKRNLEFDVRAIRTMKDDYIRISAKIKKCLSSLAKKKADIEKIIK